MSCVGAGLRRANSSYPIRRVTGFQQTQRFTRPRRASKARPSSPGPVRRRTADQSPDLPLTGGPQGHNLYEPVIFHADAAPAPWEGDSRPADVLDHHSHGCSYDTDPPGETTLPWGPSQLKLNSRPPQSRSRSRLQPSAAPCQGLPWPLRSPAFAAADFRATTSEMFRKNRPKIAATVPVGELRLFRRT